MPIIKAEPSDKYPVPFSTDEETPASFVEELMVAASTADLLSELGAPIETSKRNVREEKALIDRVIKDKDTTPLQNHNTARAISSFLHTYGQSLAFDAAQARAAITSKLMEIADCGDTKYELRALELLGKHSDIGLFTERSEVTINYNNASDLERAIKERVKRLMNADIIDVTPLGRDLDEELGTVSVGAFDDDEEAEEEEQEEPTLLGELDEMEEEEDA
jgi:hypothetical protein